MCHERLPQPTASSLFHPLPAPCSLAAIDTAALSVTNMFRPGGVALDIFGDKTTSDARRRCQPEEGEDSTLFDLHLNVAVAYTLVYGALQGMLELQPIIVLRRSCDEEGVGK